MDTILILCEISQKKKRQIPYDIPYMRNLKCGTNELIYNIETDSQAQRTDFWLPQEEEEEWDGQGVWGQQMKTITFRMDKQQDPTVQHREF